VVNTIFISKPREKRVSEFITFLQEDVIRK
jgi:hypothetical protein